MLKISSGILRGLRIKSPEGSHTRPTSERTRQSLFNILYNYRFGPESLPILDGASVIDLFAGTGAFGIECLGHGAQSVCFVENQHQTLKILNENVRIAVESLQKQKLVAGETEVIAKDVKITIPKLPSCRVLFCDPPYEKGWLELILSGDAVADCIEKGGVLVYEADKSEALPPNPFKTKTL